MEMDYLFEGNGDVTQQFKDNLPGMLGEDWFNDPDTKQQPTKMFDNITNVQGLVKCFAKNQRQISAGDARFDEKMKGMVKMITEQSTSDEIAAYRTAIGVPDAADGYNFFIPDVSETVSEADIAVHTRLAKDFGDAAHEFSIPEKNAIGAFNKVAASLQAFNTELETKGKEMIESDIVALKEKYKEKYPTMVAETDKAYTKSEATQAFKKLLDDTGFGEHIAVKNFMFELAPLINQGSTVLGGGLAPEEGEGGYPSYKYDKDGKTI